MADGSLTNSIEACFAAMVQDAMRELVPFNTMRRMVAACGKEHGVMVYGTDRIDGVVYVSYDGGLDVLVQETEAYQKAISMSTW